MFKLVLNSFKTPELLLQVTLLKKKNIVKLFCFLTLILSLPLVYKGISQVHQLQDDLQFIDKKSPNFSTNDNILTSYTDKKDYAIQTNTTYFLYDIENKLSKQEINRLTNDYLFTIVLTKNALVMNTLGTQAHRISFADNLSFSTSDFSFLLKSLTQMSYILYALVPLAIILMTGLSILLHNLSYTIASHVFFLFIQKRVRFKHLWRVSLIASTIPYVLLGLLELCHIDFPYRTPFMVIYIITSQYLVLKNFFKEHA